MRKYIVFITLTLIALGATAQIDPIAVLQSPAPFAEKAEACRLLSISGDVKALPVLEPMLANEELSHVARYALEPMPGTEADAVLRRALKATSGKLKAGVIASLGVRRDATAVSDLIALLGDKDGFVAEAAARSLGRIGAPEGIQALEKAIAQPGLPYAIMQSLGDGLFAAAESAQVSGKPADAIRIYDEIYVVEVLPVPVRAAALRGAILARPQKDGLLKLVDAIKGDNAVFFAAALRIASEIEEKKDTASTLAGVLPALSEDRKIQVIQAIGELGQDNAGLALLKEAEAGPIPVRVAALGAATRLAYAPVVPVLAGLVISQNADLSKAAKDGLSYFPGKEGDEAVKKMLKSEDALVRRAAIELIGQGALPAPVDLLMEVAADDADESVRVAALKGAQEYAGMPQMADLLGHLLKPRSNDEMLAAEQGLVLLCERQKAAPTGKVAITSAAYGELPDGPQADVTEKVKQMVSSGALSVDASNGNFGDTAPGKVKKLRVDYTDNGAPASQMVQEGQTLRLTSSAVPAEIIDALCESLAAGEGEAKLAILRVLTSTGSPKAFDTILALATKSEGDLKDNAMCAVCDWPTALALPTVMDWTKTGANDTVKVIALRGAVRILKLGQDTPEALSQHYATLLAQTTSADDRKLILSGLAKVVHASALTIALEQLKDDSVKAEAVQAAIAIAKKLGPAPENAQVLERAKSLIPELNVAEKK